MKALRVTRNGPPGEVLQVADVPVPEPGAGEVRVKVGAASLNFNDIDRCRGKLVSVPTPPPYTLGMDACGVADAAGPGGEAWLGKRVVAITKMALDDKAAAGWCRHAHYDALMADPVGAVAGLYRGFGYEVSDEHPRRMTALLKDRPKDAFGRHRYDPADFGWTYAEISEEFGDYARRYDVRPEK